MKIELTRGHALRHHTNQMENSESVVITMQDGTIIQVSHFQGAWEVWQVPEEGFGDPHCMASSNHQPDRHYDE